MITKAEGAALQPGNITDVEALKNRRNGLLLFSGREVTTFMVVAISGASLLTKAVRWRRP